MFDFIKFQVDVDIFENLLIKRNLSFTNRLKFDTFDSIKEEYDREISKKNKNVQNVFFLKAVLNFFFNVKDILNKIYL